MRQPEDWVAHTAERAKLELSVVLSPLFPALVVLASSLLLWFPGNDEGMLLGAAVIIGVPLAVPRSIIGFVTQSHKVRRVTIPVNAAGLLLLAAVAYASLI